MWLRSDAFSEGAAIPRRFTCDGEDLSPPLAWGDVPAETESLIILCDDPDAPAGTWYHWAAFNLPATLTGLEGGAAGHAEQRGFRQAINDFKQSGYNGPCPPRGHGPHHYRFRLLALSTGRLLLPDDPHCREVEPEAHGHVIEEATLTGLYER